MSLPASILESFHKKCTFLVNAILEEKLGHVPAQKELEEYLKISSEDKKEFLFYWKEELIFKATLKFEGNAVQGEWDLPPHLLKNEYIVETLNKW